MTEDNPLTSVLRDEELIRRLHLPWPKDESVEEVTLPVWILELTAEAADRIEQLLEELQKLEGVSNELCEKVKSIDEALTRRDLSEHLVEIKNLKDSYDSMKRLWEQEKSCAQYAESRVENLRASLSVIADISSGTVRRLAKSALINDGQETLDESL